MDAHDLPSKCSPAARRRTHIVVGVLALSIAWALWRGYGVLLLGPHVH